MGRDAIHRTPKRFVRKYVADCPDLIVYVNPAHPLTSAADVPAQSHSTRRQHLFQRTAFSTQDDAGSRENRATASFRGRACGRFPFATGLPHEAASAGSAVFPE